MANSVYQINKGINKSIEFRGLKAQYIWFLAAGILALIILFSILYFIGINQYIGLFIIFSAGSSLIYKVYAMSNQYGEYGLMKMMARKSVPKLVKSNSRQVFICLPKK